MSATTRFSMWGNSIAVRIPGHIARAAGIIDGTTAELSVVDGALILSPLDAAPAYQLADLVADMTDENRHGEIVTSAAQGDEFA